MSAERWSYDWADHFQAMERWKTKALECSDGEVRRTLEGFSISSVESFDYAYAFFIWAHSLRDWLIQTRAIEKKKLDEKLNRYEEWKMVKDLSNRVKHQRITRNPTDAEWIAGIKVTGNVKPPMSLELEPYVQHSGKYMRLKECILSIWNMWIEVLDSADLTNRTKVEKAHAPTD
ncbi:MAG: hypothetical protein ABJQ23_13995 [Shimia thalassica]|uniref:hypothetical protein n=1 Tax=Shimia thalassica TaxID=1715693 RepID=UPI0032976630